jgi:2,3-diketo-5-methylthio-1-phosphopentane phosphatase
MQSEPVVVCDFDGTITQVDVTDLVLAQFAHPSWQDVEQEWMRGSIGSRECLERQMALIDASADELDRVIDSVPIDPDFPKFYRSLRRRDIPFHVVTDGFDHFVSRVLRRAGLDGQLRNGTDLFASSLRIEGRRMKTSYPYPNTLCEHGCATCKAAVIRQLRQAGHAVIFIGDGHSDRFAAGEADQVFAKRALFAYCQEKGFASRLFETFAEVDTALGKLKREGAPKGQGKRFAWTGQHSRAAKRSGAGRPLGVKK